MRDIWRPFTGIVWVVVLASGAVASVNSGTSWSGTVLLSGGTFDVLAGGSALATPRRAG